MAVGCVLLRTCTTIITMTTQLAISIKIAFARERTFLHSPLLEESSGIHFPPHTYMLKLSGKLQLSRGIAQSSRIPYIYRGVGLSMHNDNGCTLCIATHVYRDHHQDDVTCPLLTIS